MRKPVFALCKQQRRRSACASAQSDWHLCCSLLKEYNICSCYVLNFQTLASLCGCPGRVESYLVVNPEDRFSGDEAQMRGLRHWHLCQTNQEILYLNNDNLVEKKKN